MHPNDIPWIAFTYPLGHFEWLVMPFGLKNKQSIFQIKMDNIFIKFNKFVCVYIDDILVHSKTKKKEHISHFKLVLSEFLKHGIVISGSKAQFFTENTKFFGVELGNGRIRLQPHIATNVLEFPNKLDTKQLQLFLRLLNYVRPFIKYLNKLIWPLYSKLLAFGQRNFNIQDEKHIEKNQRNS